MTTDYLFIEGFEIPCHIGTTDDERAIAQPLTLSIRIFLPLRKPGESDRLSDSVDYAGLINEIRNLITEREFNLIETALEQVASLILKKPLIDSVEIRAHKNVFSDIKAVGATIFRSKDLNREPNEVRSKIK